MEKDNHVLQELQVIETSGVFDIKWRGSILGLLPCLGQVSADGSYVFYSLQYDLHFPLPLSGDFIFHISLQ